MVGRHELDRLRAEQPHAVEFAAPSHHLAEAQVVHGRGDQPAAAGVEGGVFVVGEGFLAHLHERFFFSVPVVVGQEAIHLLRRHVEERVHHAEGLEEALLEEDVEGLAAQALHDEAGHVHGDAVVPPIARLELQRQFGKALGELVEILRRQRLLLAVHLVQRILWIETVGEAAGVREQMQHGHGVLGRRRLAALGIQHLQIRQFGHELLDRIGELKLAFFVEHHCRHRGDRLAHRIDAEQGVLGHRAVVVRPAVAHRLEVDDLAVARHQRDDASELLLVHVALRHGGDVVEPFGGHSGAGGPRLAEVVPGVLDDIESDLRRRRRGAFHCRAAGEGQRCRTQREGALKVAVVGHRNLLVGVGCAPRRLGGQVYSPLATLLAMMSRNCSRSACFCTLPMALRGSSATRTVRFGCL